MTEQYNVVKEYVHRDNVKTMGGIENQYLSAHHKEVLKLANNFTAAQPIFKLKHFVGGSQPNAYSELKQYMLELRAREETLENITYGLKRQRILVELEKEKLEKNDLSPAQRKLCELDIEKLSHEATKYERSLEDYYLERNKFLYLIDQLLKSPEGRLSDGRSLLEVIDDPVLSERFEKEYWTIRMAKQASMDLLAYGRIGSGNLESICQMPLDQQAQVYAIANEYSLRMENQFGLIRGFVMQNAKLENHKDPKNVPSILDASRNNDVTGIPSLSVNIQQEQTAKALIEGKVDVHRL